MKSYSDSVAVMKVYHKEVEQAFDFFFLNFNLSFQFIAKRIEK
jgi:hypothetical protein